MGVGRLEPLRIWATMHRPYYAGSLLIVYLLVSALARAREVTRVGAIDLPFPVEVARLSPLIVAASALVVSSNTSIDWSRIDPGAVRRARAGWISAVIVALMAVTVAGTALNHDVSQTLAHSTELAVRNALANYLLMVAVAAVGGATVYWLPPLAWLLVSLVGGTRPDGSVRPWAFILDETIAASQLLVVTTVGAIAVVLYVHRDFDLSV